MMGIERSGETKAFNEAWLRGGEELSIIQRIGFAVFSVAFLMAGVFCSNCARVDFPDDLLMSLMWTFAAVFFAGLGILGMRNVLRRKHGSG